MNGLILYQGPSRLDGAPIVAIATGIRKRSQNPKTGPMVQVWILRSDVHPSRAIHSGADKSICGTCILRGILERARRKITNRRRACYVKVSNAPARVWNAFRAGKYPDYNPRQHSHLLLGKSIRLGAYGDPAAVPVGVWSRLLRLSSGWTGYTHSWRRFPSLRHFLMASVETEDDAREAHARGWRTFRTRLASAPLASREISCPASGERGHSTTCSRCLACDGAGRGPQRVNISIIAHGGPPVLYSYAKTASAIRANESASLVRETLTRQS